LYFVAINNVPAELYEAAELDGASALMRMLKVTLPNITNMIKIQLILAFTGSLLAFEDVFFMTQGGPDFASTTVVLSLYQKAFNEQNFGQGMAISVIVFVVTLTFTIIQFKIMNRNNE
jgi:ABC-type sugar transport system permease subunit